jgi:hypothetical protein
MTIALEIPLVEKLVITLFPNIPKAFFLGDNKGARDSTNSSNLLNDSMSRIKNVHRSRNLLQIIENLTSGSLWIQLLGENPRCISKGLGKLLPSTGGG